MLPAGAGYEQDLNGGPMLSPPAVEQQASAEAAEEAKREEAQPM